MKFKLSSIQKLIIFSAIFFTLSARSTRYIIGKYVVQNIDPNTPERILVYLILAISIVVLIASIIGFIKIAKRIFIAKENIIVRERYAAFAWNCFWTFLISLIVGMILKVLIFP
jgi:hypothetical protein